MEAMNQKMVMRLILLLFFAWGVSAWTGEIHGRVVCDVCGDSSLGPEDHVLEGFSLSLPPFGVVLQFYVVLIEFLKWGFSLLMKFVCFLC